MSPLNAVFRLSLAVLLKSRRTLVIGLLCFMPVLGAAAGSMLVLSGLASHEVTGYFIYGNTIVSAHVYVLLVVVTLFYGTALVSDELEDKTLTYLLMRPVPKATIYIGKYLSYLVAGAVLLLPSAALCFLVTMVADPAGEAMRHLPVLLKDLGMLTLGIMAYGALYALLGAVSKRPVFVGLLFAIVWETAVTFIPGYLSKLTIKHYLTALLPHTAGERGILAFFETATPVPLAIAVLLAVTVALVALGSWVFTNREYVLEQ